MKQERYTPRQAAGIVGCSVRFLLAEIRGGNLRPVVKINARVIWIDRSALDEYMKDRTLKPIASEVVAS